MIVTNNKVKLNSHRVKEIYFKSFDEKERMPFPMMVMMSKLWHTHFISYTDDNEVVGFIYYASLFNQIYVLFFGVEPDLRSKGYGSLILQELQKQYPNKQIIVSIEYEGEDKEIINRRKTFYLRNGFKETGYYIRMSGINQELLINKGSFSKSKFRSFLGIYSNGVLWPKIWYEKKDW